MRIRHSIALLWALTGLILPLASAWAEEPFVVELVARDGRFHPAELVVPANRKVKIVIRNDSRGPIEFETTDLHREKVLGAGAQSFVMFAPLRPGSYAFFDDFHPDTAQGRIVVRP